MIDHQSQMAFATKSIDPVQLRNNVALVAKAAKEFKVPTILTTVAEKSFSGPIFNEIKDVFPNEVAIDRTTMNTWEDPRIAERVNAIGKDKSCWPACGLRYASLVRHCQRWTRALKCM
jgi:nicotinamidase-related amidase